MPRCSHAAWLAAGTVSSASAKGANAGRTARAATRERLRGDSTTFLLWRLEQHVTPGAADRARGERGHGHDRGGDATHRVAPARARKSGPTRCRTDIGWACSPPPSSPPPPADRPAHCPHPPTLRFLFWESFKT